MTTESRAADGFDPDLKDELISRVIDGEATVSDWKTLRALAEIDAGVWSEIASTQRQHAALCAAVEDVGRAADGVELPVEGPTGPGEWFDSRMRSLGSWGGWAAAAALVLVWFTGLPLPVGDDASQVHQAGLGPGSALSELGADEVLERYLDRGRRTGRVLAQVPERVVLETRPLGPHGVEVVYLRQILEREVIDSSQVYRLGRTEFGQSVLLPAEGAMERRVSY